MVLLSGVAVGLLFMVSNESRMSGNDLENRSGLLRRRVGHGESLPPTSPSLYTQYRCPPTLRFRLLSPIPPASVDGSTMTYNETITYTNQCRRGNPVSSSNTISSGSNQGLYAEIVP